MEITLERRSFNGKFVDVYENRRMVMGFTEIHFPLEDLPRMLRISPSRIIRLKQLHSDTILFSSRLESDVPGEKQNEGDGIILDQKGKAAVIATADCTPLFFRDRDYSLAGVVHIGWRGLFEGIEKKLLELLAEKPHRCNPGDLYVYLGPSIGPGCYEVGTELREKFSAKPYCRDIFYRRESGLAMDIKKGICLSLTGAGVPGDHIAASSLCTYCEAKRFPSYRRRPNSGRRIYNFLMLKNE